MTAAFELYSGAQPFEEVSFFRHLFRTQGFWDPGRLSWLFRVCSWAACWTAEMNSVLNELGEVRGSSQTFVEEKSCQKGSLEQSSLEKLLGITQTSASGLDVDEAGVGLAGLWLFGSLNDVRCLTLNVVLRTSIRKVRRLDQRSQDRPWDFSSRS